MGAEDELFAKAMRGVRRIKAEVKRQSQTIKPIQTRPFPAGGKGIIETGGHPGPNQVGRPWVLKADGITEDRLKSLAAGNPPQDIEIDLHGMNRKKACDYMAAEIKKILATGKRVICLVHGRGLHSTDGKPVLKQAVYNWLRDGPLSGHVLAVVPKPGTGGGSCLVLLRRKR
jgi:DNA-nicking Smr family endonuclease